MNRSFTVGINANASGLNTGVASAIVTLGNLARFGARAGADFARGIASGMSSASQSITQFATRSNTQLTAFYANQDRQQKQFAQGWGRVASDMQSVGQRMTVGITAPMALVAGQAFKTYAHIDSLKRGLTAVMGSADLAGREFTKLRTVAALPGLGLTEALQGSIRLQAVGFSADNARKALLAFGNAIALTGGGKAELASVTQQLAQMAGKSKVLSQDLRPIIEATKGAIAPTLNKIFGSVDPEVISSKLEAAGKDSKYFIEILTTELSKLTQVSGGPKNALENFGDSAAIAANNVVGAADKVFNLTGKLSQLGDFATKAADGFSKMSPEAQTTSLYIGGAAAAIGPLLYGLGSFVTMWPSVVKGLTAIKAGFAFITGPVGATIIAITTIIGLIATVGISIQQWNRNLDSSIDKGKLLADVQNDVAASIGSETTTLNSLLAVARDETVSKKGREEAVRRLNALAPDYLGNLRLETINTNQATIALGKYVTMLTTKAKIESLTRRAAEAHVNADAADKKPFNEFADYDWLSGDRIAANLKAGFQWRIDASSTAEIDKMAKARKVATVKKLNDEAKFYDSQLTDAVKKATEEGIQTTPVVTTPPIDFKLLGDKSSIDKLKAEVKAAKEKIESFVATNGKAVPIPIELQAEFKLKSQQLKDAKEAAKALLPKNTKTPRAVAEKNPGQDGTIVALLKRTENQLVNQIRTQGKGAPQELHDKLQAVRQEIEQIQALTSKTQRIKIEGLQTLATPATDERVASIVAQMTRLRLISPNLFTNTGIESFLTDIQRGAPTLDYYRNKIEEIKETISRLSLPGSEVDPKQIEQLTKLLGEFKSVVNQAENAAGTADAKTNPGSDGDVDAKWIAKAEARIAQMKASGQVIKKSVQELARDMQDGHDDLATSAANMLAGLGEGLSKSENPLKSILQAFIDLLGDFMIKIGTAMLIGGTLLETATTVFPFLKPLLGLKGIKGAIVGGSLIAGGGVVKGLAGSFENGALFTGESYIRVGESRKALGGGGEWVTPVDKGAALVAGELIKKGVMDQSTTPTGSGSPLDRQPVQDRLDVRITGEPIIRGSDIIFVVERTMRSNGVNLYTSNPFKPN